LRLGSVVSRMTAQRPARGEAISEGARRRRPLPRARDQVAARPRSRHRGPALHLAARSEGAVGRRERRSQQPGVGARGDGKSRPLQHRPVALLAPVLRYVAEPADGNDTHRCIGGSCLCRVATSWLELDVHHARCVGSLLAFGVVGQVFAARPMAAQGEERGPDTQGHHIGRLPFKRPSRRAGRMR